MTLTLDFEGQILKKSYLRNGMADWHGIKGMWVDIVGPMLWLSMSTSPMTLTLDFQGQILKMLYLRNGRADWHGMKGMWVDRMVHPLCDFQLWPQPWLWPWIFTVKFWKSHISEMGWPIDMESKGCESMECWTHVVTFNFPLTHDLDLGFSMSNFEKVPYMWENIWSPWAHGDHGGHGSGAQWSRLGEVTAESRLGHSWVTARSQLSHGAVTAESRLGHSWVTARSQLSHGAVTARSQLNHGIFSMITAESQLGHSSITAQVTAQSRLAVTILVTVSSRWAVTVANFFSHGVLSYEWDGRLTWNERDVSR